MDNEIFFQVEVEKGALTEEQEAYVRQCGAPRAIELANVRVAADIAVMPN